ncbi:hypothetical protein KK137_13555 [Croceibacterium sp. LX-88]|uniref:Uncharacterized protein n=1 Tax=Croceibacterium selenioxidans TaxID=2838833 RepID=A0ABS5W6R4_9SPHN|nr:hypothetical protein [Croceibacterium selenioxidans]MBT2135359.1 hypothetical protein [Croceibacterium selenioxidans]
MRPALGYLLSVGAASLSMAAVFQFQIGSASDFSPELIAVYLVFWGIAFVLTGLCAFLPFFAALQIAERWQLHSAPFFVASAVITSVALCAFAATVAGSGLPSNDPEHLSFFVAFLRFLPSFLTAGIIGGLTFWWCARESFAPQFQTDAN